MPEDKHPDPPEWYQIYDTCPCDKKCNLIKCHARVGVCEHE